VLDSIRKVKRTAKLTEVIVQQIRDLIDCGKMLPGARLPTENELAEAFGVGRSSVREALQVLEHVGLVQTRHGVGRFLSPNAGLLNSGLSWVRALQAAPAMCLLEARELVEDYTTRLAAQRAEEADIAELEALLGQMRCSAPKSLDEYFEAEIRFHLRLAQACQNPVLADLTAMLFDGVHAEAEQFMRTTPRSVEDTLEVFGALLCAVKRGDGESAAQAMARHLQLIRRILAEPEESEGAGSGQRVS